MDKMIDFVGDLIERKKKRYKEDYAEMLGDYNRENETVKGYNGRQILELLQNCDDEGAKNVLITLDSDAHSISISNDGTPFSEKGYQSLFIANLSSKTNKKKYIGNKGLGFRSVINWSKTIEVQSNNLSLQYADENIERNFNELFPEELRDIIRNEGGYSDKTIPMALLSMPDMKEIQQEDYTTTIVIHYKPEFYNDIITQLNNINPQTILFLNNIENIFFEGIEGKNNIRCTKEKHTITSEEVQVAETIIFDDSQWEIFSYEKSLPKEYLDQTKQEPERYQIKIAVEKNFSQSSPYLYSFFPTNIILNQPYILHATFDLDSTRNQLNDSHKNKFILEQVVKFTIEVAKYFSRGSASYRALEILNHTRKADTLNNLGYYELIKDAIRNENLFPCMDNTYRRYTDVLFVSNNFAKMLIDTGAKSVLTDHILPPNSDNLLSLFNELQIDDTLEACNDPIGLINKISGLILTIQQRAKFVAEIVKNCQFIKTKFPNECDVLTNQNNEVINGEEHIFTPATFSNQLSIPAFAKIQFINRELYNRLLSELNFDTSDNTNKSRFIFDSLRGFCNIHSYEPAPLASKIISETNSRLRTNPENHLEIVKEMNRCLFDNFKKNSDEEQKSHITISIPSISLESQIQPIDELYLSSAYPIGEKTAVIFGDIYDNGKYINTPAELGIDNYSDILEVQGFLLWLGVNKFVKYESNQPIENDGYFRHVMDSKKRTASTSYSLSLTKIKDFDEILAAISIEKFILWIYFDEILKKQLHNNYNDDIVKNYYYSFETLHPKPSYIKFLIEKNYSYKFEDYFIEDRHQWQNNFVIDYRHRLFVENGLTMSIINEALILLGAKENFEDLSADKVAQILNKLPEHFPTGKNSQTFYKRALNHYKVNGLKLTVPLRLFADNGDKLELYDQSQIYFSEKIKLPKNLKSKYPVFNFPSRAGGVEAINFFQINDLKNIKVEILEQDIKFIGGKLHEEFDAFIESLKPSILSFRLNDVEEITTKKIQASLCKELKIVLCSDIKYRVDDSIYSVNDYEFLHLEKNTYLVKVQAEDTLSELQRKPEFTESLADIVSLTFDVTGDKNSLKYLFGNTVQSTEKSILNDIGEDAYQEARELLGLADYKQAFWKAVFECKEIPYHLNLDDISLEKYIKDNLKVDFPAHTINYEKISERYQINTLKALFSDLDIELHKFATKYPYPISFEGYHYKKITSTILSQKNLIKSSVWNKLKNEDFEEQTKFLYEINRFENCEEFASNLSSQLKHHLETPDDSFRKYTEATYGKLNLIDGNDADNIQAENLKNFTSDEIFEIRQNEKLKSLIYFPNTTEYIKKQLALIYSVNTKESNHQEDWHEVKVKLVSSDNLKGGKAKIFTTQGKKNVFTPSTQDQKKLKQIGNRSEEVVFNHLKTLPHSYQNLYKASDDNEGLHYDIRYSNENGELIYIEVKTFNHGHFYMSPEEYEFGKHNADNYEIWLVRNNEELICIKDFFTNQKYEAETSQYIIHLN